MSEWWVDVGWCGHVPALPGAWYPGLGPIHPSLRRHRWSPDGGDAEEEQGHPLFRWATTPPQSFQTFGVSPHVEPLTGRTRWGSADRCRKIQDVGDALVQSAWHVIETTWRTASVTVLSLHLRFPKPFSYMENRLSKVHIRNLQWAVGKRHRFIWVWVPFTRTHFPNVHQHMCIPSHLHTHDVLLGRDGWENQNSFIIFVIYKLNYNQISCINLKSYNLF